MVPAVPGVLTADEVLATARSIAVVQDDTGAIAWEVGRHLDPWDHVQAAMALSAAGLHEAAVRAYGWSRDAQRPDGTWAKSYTGGVEDDPMVDTNMCAYVATGVWHHWRVTADRAFVDAMWPTVERAVEAVLARQCDDGAIAWTDGTEDALLAGCASIHLALRCAVGLAGVVGEERPAWTASAARLRAVVDGGDERFLPKPHSMDWYYPLLGAAMDPAAADERVKQRWDDFVVEGKGVRCVVPNPWVTGAETCELVLALDALGHSDAAQDLFAAMQHLREDDGSYWTGRVLADGNLWPVERTTWTAATVVLAADALSRTTPGNGLFRGEGLA